MPNRTRPWGDPRDRGALDRRTKTRTMYVCRRRTIRSPSAATARCVSGRDGSPKPEFATLGSVSWLAGEINDAQPMLLARPRPKAMREVRARRVCDTAKACYIRSSKGTNPPRHSRRDRPGSKPRPDTLQTLVRSTHTVGSAARLHRDGIVSRSRRLQSITPPSRRRRRRPPRAPSIASAAPPAPGSPSCAAHRSSPPVASSIGSSPPRAAPP